MFHVEQKSSFVGDLGPAVGELVVPGPLRPERLRGRLIFDSDHRPAAPSLPRLELTGSFDRGPPALIRLATRSSPGTYSAPRPRAPYDGVSTGGPITFWSPTRRRSPCTSGLAGIVEKGAAPRRSLAARRRGGPAQGSPGGRAFALPSLVPAVYSDSLKFPAVSLLGGSARLPNLGSCRGSSL